jgi:hypothetical protein
MRCPGLRQAFPNTAPTAGPGATQPSDDKGVSRGALTRANLQSRDKEPEAIESRARSLAFLLRLRAKPEQS